MPSLTKKLRAKTGAETETVPACVLCGNEKSTLLFTNIDRQHHLPGEFGIAECVSCKMIRLSPRPALDEIGSYYLSDEYYSYQKPAEIKDRGFLSRFRDEIRLAVLASMDYPVSISIALIRILRPVIFRIFYGLGTYGFGDRFPRFMAGGRALDIGCGNAAFLGLLKKYGWEVAGVDLSEAAADTARKNFDIDVFVGNAEEAPFPQQSFDYIRMNHSIEHVPDPVKTLQTAAKLMKPGGTIYIETPNAAAYGLKKMKEYWMPLETPRHLFLFTPQNLRDALETAGFKIAKIKTSRQNMYPWYDTYRVEETLGEFIAQRPQTRILSLPGAVFYYMASRWRYLMDKNSGDFLHGWAVRDEDK